MIPALVQWEMTERCPYHCIHCYLLDASLPRRPGELSDAEMMTIAKRLVDNRIFFITLTGGEPLTRRDLVVQLSQYLSDHGVTVSLNTCLAPLTEAALAGLRVNHYLISCPSAVPERYRLITGGGNYHRFEDRLRSVIDTGGNATLNMVVSQLNKHDVRTTAERLATLGVKRFATTPVSLNARAPKYRLPLSLAETQTVLTDLIWVHEQLGLEVDVMEALPRAAIPSRAFELQLPFVYRACRAGQRNGTISPNGDVRPCGHNPQIYGNILRDDVGQIWDRMKDWRHEVGNHHRSCLACDIVNSRGGCLMDTVARIDEPRAFTEVLSASTPVMTSPTLPTLKATTVVRPCRQYQSRPEGDGYLVSSGRARDIIHVNAALHLFLEQTRTCGSISLAELAARYGTTAEDPEFQRVIGLLVFKHFFITAPDTV